MDIDLYNRNEQQAIKDLPQLHEDQKWNIENSHGHAHQVDFPLRVNNISECSCLLNRFQRERWEMWMNDLGGIDKEENGELGIVLRQLKEFADAHNIPDYKPPSESVLAALALWRKIRIFKPGMINILEIGPGSGITPAVFRRDPSIKNYTEIETTQSLYVLQSGINDWFYKKKHWDGYDNSPINEKAKVWHFPWWRFNDLKNSNITYDVITANACLSELTDEAFEAYLDLFAQKSNENSILIVQDPGGSVARRPASILAPLLESGWHGKAFSKMYMYTALLTRSDPKHPLIDLMNCYAHMEKQNFKRNQLLPEFQ